MPHVHAIVESPVPRSFRVDQIASMFDLPAPEHSNETFDVDLPDTNDDWQIGVIVGPSGSGKSTVARYAYGEQLYQRAKWPDDDSILNGFDRHLSTRQIVQVLNAVGFSSPPAWLRPYRVLSGGQQMRCDLARAILGEKTIVVFDEFTSVVDRTVAKACSNCVQRTVRSQRFNCRQFVAVTCHYDIVQWLEPDWVLDMATCDLARGRLRRAERLNIEVRKCNKALWPMFASHHYLSHSLHAAARCYAAILNNEPVGFLATLAQMGFKGQRRVHRLVVQPDYQGLGIGRVLLNSIATHEKQEGYRVRIRTSHPGLIHSLKRSDHWMATNISRGNGRGHEGLNKKRAAKYTDSTGRITVGFEYTGE